MESWSYLRSNSVELTPKFPLGRNSINKNPKPFTDQKLTAGIPKKIRIPASNKIKFICVWRLERLLFNSQNPMATIGC
jgi:hypothetical protein